MRNRAAVREKAEELAEQFDVRTASVDTPAGTLSGGNQQKVIVAREFTHAQRLLIAAQPTRGLDVGSIQYIHARIVAERDAGAAVLIVSSELDEVSPWPTGWPSCTRGASSACSTCEAIDRNRIGLLMAGTPLAGPAPPTPVPTTPTAHLDPKGEPVTTHPAEPADAGGPPPEAETRPRPARRRCGAVVLDTLKVPVLAIFSALVVGGLLIIFTNPDVPLRLGPVLQRPAAGPVPVLGGRVHAYSALFLGALGSRRASPRRSPWPPP